MRLFEKIFAPKNTPSSGGYYYRIGGYSAFVCASFALLQMIIEVVGISFIDPVVPQSILGWFNLLQNHRLLGLTELTFFQIPAFMFAVPLFLALYFLLKPVHETSVTLATAFAFIGISIYLATNSAFALLSLSDKYAQATEETEKSLYLASGQSLLSLYEGTGINVGVVLVLISVLIFSTVMLQSHIFKPVTAYIGLLAGMVGIFYYLQLFVPALGVFILEAAGLIFVVWIILVGRQLLQLRAPISP